MKLKKIMILTSALLGLFSAEALGVIQTKTLIKDVKAKFINGGFNPVFAGVLVKASVLVGSNKCQAQKYKAKLIRRKEGDKIHIIGIKSLKNNYRRGVICSMEYRPVFKSASLQLRYRRDKVRDIIARDVEEYGRDLSVFKLLGNEPPAEGKIEKVLGLTHGGSGITFQVYSSGCTKKDSFRVKIYESYPVQVELIRVIPDRCRAYVRYGRLITFSWKELGLRPNERFFITNPLSFQR